VPFDQMRSVAVTSHSATSVALLRVLVGPDVVFSPLRASVYETLDAVDGVLLIADEALAEMRRPSAPFATDLGERWREHTGLPMVFGVWAVRRQVLVERPEQLERICAVIGRASERHTEQPDSVVRAAAARFPFPEDFIRHYFTRLSYDFGASERQSLARFFELAHQAGELAAIPSLPD
jgi:chorismate dehydratase